MAVGEEFIVGNPCIQKEDLTFHLMPHGEKRKPTLEHAAGQEKRGQEGAAESLVLPDTANEPPQMETQKTVPFTVGRRLLSALRNKFTRQVHAHTLKTTKTLEDGKKPGVRREEDTPCPGLRIPHALRWQHLPI